MLSWKKAKSKPAPLRAKGAAPCSQGPATRHFPCPSLEIAPKALLQILHKPFKPLCDILHSHRGGRLLYREIFLLVTTKPTASLFLHTQNYVTPALRFVDPEITLPVWSSYRPESSRSPGISLSPEKDPTISPLAVTPLTR